MFKHESSKEQNLLVNHLRFIIGNSIDGLHISSSRSFLPKPSVQCLHEINSFVRVISVSIRLFRHFNNIRLISIKLLRVAIFLEQGQMNDYETSYIVRNTALKLQSNRPVLIYFETENVLFGKKYISKKHGFCFLYVGQ